MAQLDEDSHLYAVLAGICIVALVLAGGYFAYGAGAPLSSRSVALFVVALVALGGGLACGLYAFCGWTAQFWADLSKSIADAMVDQTVATAMKRAGFPHPRRSAAWRFAFWAWCVLMTLAVLYMLVWMHLPWSK